MPPVPRRLANLAQSNSYDSRGRLAAGSKTHRRSRWHHRGGRV